MNQKFERLIRYLGKEGPVICLDSQSAGHPASRESFLAARPSASIRCYGDTVIEETGKSGERYRRNPWKALEGFLERNPGWLFGYLGYDLKNHIERLHSQNDDPVGAPDLFLMAPSLLVRIDRDGEKPEVLAGEMPDPGDDVYPGSQVAKAGSLESTVSRERYLEMIRAAQDHITEGDFYEINLSHMMKADFEGSPLSLYRKMSDVGPVPFGAYLSFDRWSVCCQSPERFLAKRGDRVFSQPIKGTRKRSKDPERDEILKSELRESAKERAENLMIVDLVRNDLSRIARPESVRVSSLFEVQSFETVHQMVSTVEAVVEKASIPDILKACFPMGSMTGAPKISAMRSIESLENYRRGIYSGAIGYITPDRDFDFNVVIRTAIIEGRRLFYPVGGAITSDSDPEEEWEETIVKTRALTESL